MFRAALTSRSCQTPHAGHVHSRTSRSSSASTKPQARHVLEDGYHLSILTSVRPYHAALYSSWRTNCDQPTSAMAFANLWFFSMFLTASVSRQITWFSHMSLVDVCC